jgi:hypothetical protein
MIVAIPVDGVVIGVIAAIPAGKILQGHPMRVLQRVTHLLPSAICLKHPLPFHHNHGLEPCDQCCQAGVMDDVDDLLGIFVSRRSLFSE